MARTIGNKEKIQEPETEMEIIAPEPVVTSKPEIIAEPENVKKLLRWRKTGGGSLRLAGRIIKPGQSFTAYLDEIPKAFIQSLECLDKELLKEQSEAKPVAREIQFTVRNYKGNLFDVVNKQGKAINLEKLTEQDAQNLCNVLNG
jgi:hypothetical protein